jgi:hypothetical protein
MARMEEVMQWLAEACEWYGCLMHLVMLSMDGGCRRCVRTGRAIRS